MLKRACSLLALIALLSFNTGVAAADVPDIGAGGKGKTARVEVNQTGRQQETPEKGFGETGGSQSPRYSANGSKAGGGSPSRARPIPFNVTCTRNGTLCQPLGYLPNLPGQAPAQAQAQGQAEPAEQVDPAVVAQQAIAQLTLPDTDVKVGPPPSINEWKMAVVGYPLWLWTDGPDTQTTTVTQQGITITLTASRANTTFDMGDGTTQTCATSTAWSESVTPGAPSPDCGHTYLKPSLPKSNYTITATAHWNVAWTALGQAGTVPLDVAGTTTLPVGELQAVIVDR